jgi:hypothetical protein
LVAKSGFAPEMRIRQLSAPERMVETLIHNGAAVNAATEEGLTLLMAAVARPGFARLTWAPNPPR